MGIDRYLECCLAMRLKKNVQGETIRKGSSGKFVKSPHSLVLPVSVCTCVCVRACKKRGPWPLRELCEETTAVHSQQLIGPYLAVPFIFIFYQLLSIICVLSWVWDLILFG